MKHVLILSGGMDSYTLLHSVLRLYSVKQAEDTVHAISFEYGQRHRIEVNQARIIAEKAGVPHTVIDVTIPNSSRSALTGAVEVPEGHYAAESMKQTVVPGRNTLFLATALAFAEGMLESDDDRAWIYYGAHAGDHAIYPDCRPEFIRHMAAAIHDASDGRVRMSAPFRDATKGEIVKVGIELGIYDGYADTHTCYQGTRPACGKCGACVERLQAFDFAGVQDPLAYVDRTTYTQYA